jgi:hypothetical protein
MERYFRLYRDHKYAPLIVGTYMNPNVKQQLMASIIKHITRERSNQESKIQLETDKQTQNLSANLTSQ